MERVVLYRPSAKDARLIALVFSEKADKTKADAGSVPLESVITNMLDEDSLRAFSVEFQEASTGSVERMKVSIVLRDGTESRTFSRLVNCN